VETYYLVLPANWPQNFVDCRSINKTYLVFSCFKISKLNITQDDIFLTTDELTPRNRHSCLLNVYNGQSVCGLKSKVSLSYSLQNQVLLFLKKFMPSNLVHRYQRYVINCYFKFQGVKREVTDSSLVNIFQTTRYHKNIVTTILA